MPAFPAPTATDGPDSEGVYTVTTALSIRHTATENAA